jgi:23S rRNA (uracil1939-C5)-methyltransferase
MGKRKPLPLLTDIEIIDIAAEGNAIAKLDNKVLFIPQGIPGDIVDVQLTRKRTSFMEGYIVTLKKASPLRVEPFCEHFGVCGGCKWQHLPYPEQLKWKQKQVADSLQRIAKVEVEQLHQILPSENTRFYRNKLEYTFSENRWLPKEMITSDDYVREPGLGFHIPGMFDKVLDINYCYHQPDPSNEIRLALKQFVLENNIEFFHLRNKTGFMRNLIIRNTTIGEWMVIVVFGADDSHNNNLVMNFLSERFPIITSLMYVVNTKLNDTIHDLDIQPFKGREYIIEEMEGLRFKIGAKSFFQTNSLQAYNLYKITRDYAGLTGSEVVYDLYTGTGTIANFVAKNASKVIGIEYVEDAIADAKVNSQINHINNTLFFAGDMKDILSQSFIDEHGRPDVIITDPPRAGMHPDVVKAILYAAPKRIVYVSCNPATQARDIQLLSENYSVAEVQPVDMFPHTHHVENVALLIKKA